MRARAQTGDGIQNGLSLVGCDIGVDLSLKHSVDIYPGDSGIRISISDPFCRGSIKRECGSRSGIPRQDGAAAAMRAVVVAVPRTNVRYCGVGLLNSSEGAGATTASSTPAASTTAIVRPFECIQPYP